MTKRVLGEGSTDQQLLSFFPPFLLVQDVSRIPIVVANTKLFNLLLAGEKEEE